jgi:hypothetical protein
MIYGFQYPHGLYTQIGHPKSKMSIRIHNASTMTL